jgi:diguanylate cyclase (GGDEF)-like protein/PAS domain S-box-containing protein
MESSAFRGHVSGTDGESQNSPSTAVAVKDMNANLPQNWDSPEQQTILDGLPALIFLERAGRIVFANAEARHLLGWAEEKWVSRPVEEVLWGLFPGTAEPQTALTGGQSSSPFHATLATRSGRLAPVEGTYCALGGELRDAVIVAQPVGRDRMPRPRLMEDVLASLPEAVAIVRGSRVLYTNAAFTRMFGYSADEVSGGDLRNFILPETRLHEHAMLEKAIEDYGRAALETVRMTKDGQLIDVALHIAPLLVGGEKAGNVLTYRDVGERKQVEAKLQHDAMHDVLTGLPNRALFQDRVTLALMRRARRREGCGILYLDLDNFETVNATLGHAAGDLLLVALADRLRCCLRPQDTAARLGEDEFGILVENVMNAYDLEVVAKRVLGEMERPFEILGHSFPVKVSIGVAMAGKDDVTAESLLRDADLALYHARQDGGQRYEVFDRQMGSEPNLLHERERDLRQALSNRKFELWYEPIFRLGSGELESFESILRFRRADGSIDTFNDLLPMAEETGLSISIGREALETVCRQLRDWSNALPGNTLALAVNLTHRQFYHEDMAAHLKKTLAATKVEPSRLVLEIPETAVNERPDAALAMVQRLADCGVRVALDHFGAGLAAFNPLARLPMQMVKMDAQLSIAATKTGAQLALVESVIHLGKAMGMQVAAQGIETQEQLNTLRRLGCELGQGPLFSEAVDAAGALEIAAGSQRALPPTV